MRLAKGFRALVPTRRDVVASIVVAVVAAVVVAAAIIYPGIKTADVDLNDGGVWVTNSSQNMVGHLNNESKLLDGGFMANATEFDVLQHASTVFMRNGDQGMLNPVDVPAMALTSDLQLPSHARVSFGDYALSITDSTTGQVWASTAGALGSFNAKSTKPVLKNIPGAVAAVDSTNTVHVADVRNGRMVTFAVAEDGTISEPEYTAYDALSAVTQPQITTVGEKAVVLDPATGILYLPGGETVQLPNGRTARLQQTGPASDFVAVATAGALIEQPLDGSDYTLTELDTDGSPAAPVQQDGCVHAAWSGSGVYIRDCADDGADLHEDIPQLGGQAELVFRVNRDVVVLNDTFSGTVWLVNQNMMLVQNWQDLIPPKKDTEDPDEDAADENLVNTLPDRTKENRPPTVKDDEFGARPGQTAVLPILDNDSDPDGDVLTATVTGDGPKDVTIQRIYDGTGLQAVVPPDAKPGTRTFRYEASDGRGGTAVGTVRLDIKADAENSAPVQKRETTILLEQGASITQNVLSDWIDPDGDDIFLGNAEATTDGDRVQARPDGRLHFQDIGSGYGKKEVKITVTDGSSSTTGVVTFDVRPPGKLPPVANADHVSVVAGQDVLVTPLKNDVDPDGSGLRLARVDAVQDVTIDPQLDVGAFNFSADKPGTYYVKYLVSNGPGNAEGLVRVDVISGNKAGPPVAVHDVALLPQGGEVLVDVLGNDTDPAGGVLVVRSVTVPQDAPVSVAVLNHDVLRITDTRGLAGQLELEYTVSNGTASATGQVSVLPMPAPAKLKPPQAADDEATVRAGDVVTIDVLENDHHPNNDELTLDPKLVETPPKGAGRIFTTEDSVRFIAGPKAQTVSAVYNVRDSTGQKDSGRVTIKIVGADPKNNKPPTPEDLTGRVLGGSSTRIAVPLDGVDPDGDSVRLVGIDTPPSMGTAVIGSNYIDYTAAGDAGGTDSFTYTVEDRLGARATGTVLVGIAPRAESNHEPVPVDDAVTLRPGKRVAVDVLSNDSDPDGDPLALVDNLDAEGMNPKIKDNQVLLTAPQNPDTYAVHYQIHDGRGAKAVGTIRMHVDPNAPRLRPIARDDRVTVSETMGKTAVDVPVLDNDEDPDGVADELKISFPPSGPGATGTATATGEGVVNVTLTDKPQTVAYTVTDVDGLEATAVIWVPGVGKQYPILADETPRKVKAGKTLTVDLDEAVKVRAGHSPRITEADKVHAVGADGSELLADEDTLTFTADKEYFGPGSITFEVTDGDGPDDPAGLESTLTIPITVIAAPDVNHPPTLSSASLDVAEAEDAVTLDVARLADDPDKQDRDQLEFALDGDTPAGIEVSLDGTTLSARATSDARVGSSDTVTLSVTDGRSDPVTSEVTINVTASSRPLAVANDDVVADANQGETVTVDVLSNDTNPFEDAPLTLIDAKVETGHGNVSTSGDSVAVTPGKNFVGTMVVRYTVGDKTKAADRRVDAAIRLTVRGAPEAPVTPRVEEVGNGKVVLSWRPPSDNGAAITHYTVHGSHGVTQKCGGTTCTITGLTNDTIYTFTVTATNEVGTSEKSPRSAEARPDAKPDRPAPPKLTYGDHEVKVQWTAPHSDGSPVSSYNLQISPAPPSGVSQKSDVTGTSLTWEGLANGTAYRVRVQALNDAPDPSEWSEYSASAVPAGPPATPAAPSTSGLKPVGGQSQLQISWNAPDDNGAKITKYTVREYRGGSLSRTLPATSTTSTAVRVANSEAEYTYTVTATNKAGTSDPSAHSAPRHAFGKPSAVNRVSIKPTNTAGAGGRIRVNFDALSKSARNGARANQISYRATVNGGSAQSIRPGGDTIAGLNNGSSYRVTVTAVSSGNGASYTSAGTTSNAATPYGSPGTPSISASGGSEEQKWVDFSWSPPGGAHDVAKLQISVEGGNWQNVGTGSGTKRVKGGYEESLTMKVRACNSVGDCGDADSATDKTGKEKPPPPPEPTQWKIWVTDSVRSCMELPGFTSDNYHDGSPAVCDGDHWSYPAGGPRNKPQSLVYSRCYYGPYRGSVWYLQHHGTRSKNDGLMIKGKTVNEGVNPPSGMPHC